MAISMDRLYVRNIPEIQSFLSENNHELCSFLKEMDSTEEVAQFEEGDHEALEGRWGAIAMLGTITLLSGLSFAYDYKQACTLNKDFKLSSSSISKFMRDGLRYSTSLGVFTGVTVAGCFKVKAHWEIEKRIEKKIDSIRIRIIEEKAKGSNAIDADLQELELSKKFFKKLLKKEENDFREQTKPLNIVYV